jgi:hypothetical protein
MLLKTVLFPSAITFRECVAPCNDLFFYSGKCLWVWSCVSQGRGGKQLTLFQLEQKESNKCVKSAYGAKRSDVRTPTVVNFVSSSYITQGGGTKRGHRYLQSCIAVCICAFITDMFLLNSVICGLT